MRQGLYTLILKYIRLALQNVIFTDKICNNC